MNLHRKSDGDFFGVYYIPVGFINSSLNTKFTLI